MIFSRSYLLSANDDRSWQLFMNPMIRPTLFGPNDARKETLIMPLYSITPYENGDVDVRVYETLTPNEGKMEDLNDILEPA
jgi:hypothetical protein